MVIAVALLLFLPVFMGQLPHLFDDLTATTARLTLVSWAAAALAVGGWRLVRSDAT